MLKQFKFNRILSLLLVNSALLLGLGACSNETTETQSAPPQTTESTPAPEQNQQPTKPVETILVGSEINYTPFEYKDPKGQPTGFEVELLEEVAKAEGFKVNFIHHKRSELEDTLNNGTYQIWASALSISPERLEKMDMSEPFLDFERALFVLDIPKNEKLQTASDFKGKMIATNKGSKSNIDTIKSLGAKPILSESFFLSLATVYDNQVDGSMGDSRIFQYYQTQNHDIKTKIIPIDGQKKQIGFAVKKGNTELLNKLNSGLNKVKADGTLDRLIEKWFGKQQ